MRLLWLIVFLTLPCHAAMNITRELIAPEHVVPGQPVRVAVTFWTDGWFNPPPTWPDFPVENGDLLTTAIPNQLVTRREGGTTWSGVRMERQVAAWDHGTLRLPAQEITFAAAGEAPTTVQLPPLEKNVTWPNDVQQPDRFLPASRLTLTQQVNTHTTHGDKGLRAGDVIERVVTVRAGDISPVQIPQLLFAIPGSHSQRLTAKNSLITSGRGDIDGAQRIETLRYLPIEAGEIVLPPIKLRWWDTTHQQWQLAELPGSRYTVGPALNAGAESVLKGKTDLPVSLIALFIALTIAGCMALWFLRHALRRSGQFLTNQYRRFWKPTALPGLVPKNRSHL
ncbi:BatD family protein [Enterobacter hormaechei]|uniref:BatD family protein n=1 Tax=Enterobacter hormaechei TaxID=158836 RepID=UPI001980E7C9|nr:BatD family protein [Enterobacter hormaechei]MBN4832679.1 BatD family protein [Enterobacter hormaechei]